MAGVEIRGRTAAVDCLPEGVAVFGFVVGLRLARKTAETMQGNWNR